MEGIHDFIEKKQTIANIWAEFFNQRGYEFIRPIEGAVSNNWLNSVVLS